MTVAAPRVRRPAPARATAAEPAAAARRRPRVVFVSITFDPEPGAIRGLPLAKRLRDSGRYDVAVIAAVPWYPLGRTYPGYRMRAWQWEDMDGIRVLRLPLYPSHDSSAVRRLATYFSFMLTAATIGVALIGRADVVYYFDNLPTTGLAARLLARLRGGVTVQHIADMWPESVTESGMLRDGVLRRTVSRVLGAWCSALYRAHRHITVLSPGFARMLVERGVPASKVSVVYNWADEDRFFPVPRDEALARELGFAGRFNVLYAGNLGPMQGLETSIRAAALVRDAAPHLQLVIVGGGPSEASLRALAEELGATNVRFVGRRPLDEMNRINALADVLLVQLRDRPFLHATIPSKTQVSLAAGRPILLAVRGDAADLIQRADAGRVVAPDSPDDLAAAMRELAAMPAQALTAMGERGRTFYERELSLDRGATAMMRIFDEALA